MPKPLPERHHAPLLACSPGGEPNVRPHLLAAFAAVSLLALSACSHSQPVLPSGAFSGGSLSLSPFASAPSPCPTFDPPTHRVSGVYQIPSAASGMSAECAIDEALSSGQEVVGYDDTAFYWQSLNEMSQPIPMPSADVSSPTNERKEFEKLAPRGAPVATVFNGVLPLSVVAAVRQGDASVGTFQGYADSKAILDRMLGRWESVNAGLVTDAFAPAAPPSPKPLTHDPKVWMEVGRYSSSSQINDAGHQSGTASAGFVVYRLNTSNPKYDTFLISIQGTNSVTGFNGCKFNGGTGGRGHYCEWTNWVGEALTMHVEIATAGGISALGQIVDSQPKNSVSTGTYELSEGADLKAEVNCSVTDAAGVEGSNASSSSAYNSCGVTAGGTYSTKATQTWNVQSRNIRNRTAPNGTKADFGMAFSGWNGNSCTNPGSLPDDLKSTGDFGASAIVRIPRYAIYTSSTPRLRLIAVYRGATASWYYFLSCSDANPAQAAEALSPEFELPTFSVQPTNLSVSAGNSVKFAIYSKNPELDCGLMPSLWLFQGGKFIAPAKAGLEITADNQTALAILRKRAELAPRVQTWTVAASSKSTKGTYTLFVDTHPGGESDSTRLGGIPVTLTIN